MKRPGPSEGTPSMFLCPRCGAPALPALLLTKSLITVPARCTRCDWKAEPITSPKDNERN